MLTAPQLWTPASPPRTAMTGGSPFRTTFMPAPQMKPPMWMPSPAVSAKGSLPFGASATLPATLIPMPSALLSPASAAGPPRGPASPMRSALLSPASTAALVSSGPLGSGSLGSSSAVVMSPQAVPVGTWPLSRAASDGRVPRALSFDDSALDPPELELSREEHPHAAKVFDLIDGDCDGCISKLDFITAMQRQPTVSEYCLPGVNSSRLLTDAEIFDAVDEAFERIGSGKQRLLFSDFAAHFHKARGDKTPKTRTVSGIFDLIDRDGNGSISKLDLIAGMQRDASVSTFVLPGIDSNKLMTDRLAFDALDNLWNSITCGSSRMSFDEFNKHFRQSMSDRTPKSKCCREIFEMIDSDRSGSISKLKFFAAMQHNAKVDNFILPGTDSSLVMSNEWSFDAVDAVFEAIAGGKKRINYTEFETYFIKVGSSQPIPRALPDRSRRRVLIIGPGFGQQMNPMQGRVIEQAGFQVKWVTNIPNPEQWNFPVDPYLGNIAAELDRFRPDVLACASKGGVYLVGLWRTGIWRGPTVLINAHPALQQLPQGVPVVLAHGANDEVYPARGRHELEGLLATGTPDLCFLYFSANSGQVYPGQFTREGDFHNMESLLQKDCLPRLIDAVLCPEGPEVHMIRTWPDRLSETRIAAERWLGYTPERLRRLWASPGKRGREKQKLFEVPRESEEFEHIVAAFKAMPREAPAYQQVTPEKWQQVNVVRVERVENGTQEEGCTRPYYHSVRMTFEHQGLDFEPGIHTCWAFHGADAEAIDSIITNEVNGFQPLATGSRNSSVWGSGTYFARDAQYVAGSHFCGKPALDGTRQMLMSLLVTGMPCLGDPEHRGVLPLRRKPHRYNSSVDCLSSPEVFIIQQSGAAIPAYLLTFM